jgi:beta-glucosidase/6-phospho-beta-glucosidase/beta-galactosidase
LLEDIARIAALGVPMYSFSLSWSRIFPFGRGAVNEEALAHYEDLIQTCYDYGVEPAITLYHWDLPLYLQNLYGGWLDQTYEHIVDDFVEYARVVFERYGNRIKHWYTFNEPIVFCDEYPYPENYFRATTVPPKHQPYVCGHNVLLAHGKTYRLARSLGINGTITFKNNGGFKIPLTNSSEDALATQRAWDFNEGWFANPIYIDGDYPQNLKDYVSGFLPEFTEEQKAEIKGSADFFAHDAYSASFYMAPEGETIADCVANSSDPLYPGCFNTTNFYSDADGGWGIGPAADPTAPWLHKTSDWLPAFLHYIQDTWKSPGGVAVTEFGFAEPFEGQKTIRQDILFDPIRSSYYHDYLEGILIALSEGVKVVGALGWSIFDNLEWAQGYTSKFGMQYVNLTTQERFYKASFFEFVNVFKTYHAGYNQTMA